VSYQFTILQKLKNVKTNFRKLKSQLDTKQKTKQNKNKKNKIFILAQIRLVMFNDKHNQDKTCLLGLNTRQKAFKKQQEIIT
jgi:hypothetical protein